MDSDQFERLVQSLEAKQQRSPRMFIGITGALAALGFIYLLVVLVVCLLLTAGLVTVVLLHPSFVTLKIGLVLGLLFGGMSWAILRSLWVRLQAPEGLSLNEKNVPGLMKLISELRTRIGASKFHDVLLDGQFNASVTQVPRLGVFGWHRNYLLLGLPLLQTMGPKEFEAVLAHEFAHLAGGHGGFGNWLYRLRRSWECLFARLATQQTGGTKILSVFLEWFWPRFNARAFVLSRANEYEADALAARLTGPQHIASALKRMAVFSRHLDECFWDDVFRRAALDPEPPKNVYDGIPQVLRAGLPDSTGEKWMRQAYLMNTTTADTHPCLRDRLLALEQLPEESERGELPLLGGPTAAEVFLGGQEPVLSAQLGERWARTARTGWMARHEETKSLASTIRETSSQEESVERLWKKADALAGLNGHEAAQPAINRILEMDANHAGALFARGAFRLGKDDPGGIPDIERAMESDLAWGEPGLQQLADYHHRHGNKASLKEIERRWQEHSSKMAEAQLERGNAGLSDTYVRHELAPQEIERLREAFSSEPDIHAVWCARKVTKCMRHVPMHVLAIEVRVPWWHLRLSSTNQKLVNRIAAKINPPGTLFLFIREKELKMLGEHVASREHSEIYRRDAASMSAR